MEIYKVGSFVACSLNGKIYKGKVLDISKSETVVTVEVHKFHFGFLVSDLQLWDDYLIECMAIEESMSSELRCSIDQVEWHSQCHEIPVFESHETQAESHETLHLVHEVSDCNHEYDHAENCIFCGLFLHQIESHETMYESLFFKLINGQSLFGVPTVVKSGLYCSAKEPEETRKKGNVNNARSMLATTRDRHLSNLRCLKA